MASTQGVGGNSNADPRATVCRNWLQGNCPNKEACRTGFHIYDLSIMPMCPSFYNNEICTAGASSCIYRHQCPLECIMYKMGFCPNGPSCFFTHVKRPDSPPSVAEVLEMRRQALSRPIDPCSEISVAPPVQQNPVAPSVKQHAQPVTILNLPTGPVFNPRVPGILPIGPNFAGSSSQADGQGNRQIAPNVSGSNSQSGAQIAGAPPVQQYGVPPPVQQHPPPGQQHPQPRMPSGLRNQQTVPNFSGSNSQSYGQGNGQIAPNVSGLNSQSGTQIAGAPPVQQYGVAPPVQQQQYGVAPPVQQNAQRPVTILTRNPSGLGNPHVGPNFSGSNSQSYGQRNQQIGTNVSGLNSESGTQIAAAPRPVQQHEQLSGLPNPPVAPVPRILSRSNSQSYGQGNAQIGPNVSGSNSQSYGQGNSQIVPNVSGSNSQSYGQGNSQIGPNVSGSNTQSYSQGNSQIDPNVSGSNRQSYGQGYPPNVPRSLFLIGNCRYFVIKNNDQDILRYATKSGLWKIEESYGKDSLNKAFLECAHVILIFYCNETRQFQGCAKMMTKIGDPVPGLWNDQTWELKYIGEVCQIRWFKVWNLLREDFLKMPTNTMAGTDRLNPIESVQTSRDGEEMDSVLGQEIFTLFLYQPTSELQCIADKYGTSICIKDGRIEVPQNEPSKPLEM